MTLINISEPEQPLLRGFALFRLGFRPFFLLGSICGLLVLGYFIMLISGMATHLPSRWDMVEWHRHEMLFGFVGAIVAGFLLTAVPNWTGLPTVKGKSLAALTGIWCAGRVCVFISTSLPETLVMVVDASFFVGCALAIAPALIRSNNKRNYGFIVLLLLFALASALTHSDYADAGIRLGLGVVTIMMTLIGGRVIPFFTERRLNISITRTARIEKLTIVCTLLAVLCNVIIPDAPWLYVLFIAAGVVNLWRFSTWQTVKTLGIPLLWVLHVGYIWLIFSFFAKAAVLMRLSVPSAFATHSLTAGAMGILILGMIARVSLGHSGRPLEIGKAMHVAFVAINLAAFLRVFSWCLPMDTMTGFQLAALCWVMAYGIFVMIYTPILLRPRLDGKDG
ncbi:MAG: NnrS family protein [Alphaproteobacteria bacterium]|nr:NnrS family protein [Alphaproteobacteria bacterium]